MNPTKVIEHAEYLRRTLRDAKLELEEARIRHRIAIAEHNMKTNMLQEQIDSIENQLQRHA